MVAVKIHTGNVDADALKGYHVLVVCDNYNKKELL